MRRSARLPIASDIVASTTAQSVATVDANGTLGRNTTLLSSVAALQTGSSAAGGSLMHRFDTDTPIALGVGFSFADKKNNAFKAGVAGEF